MLVAEDLDLRMHLTVIGLSFFFLALLLIALLFVGLRRRSLRRRDSDLKERQNLERRLRSFDAAKRKEGVERK